jgi:hypothetical protein
MPIAGADLEAEPPVKRGGGLQVMDGVDDVIEAARHKGGDASRYFIGENDVGCRNAE